MRYELKQSSNQIIYNHTASDLPFHGGKKIFVSCLYSVRHVSYGHLFTMR